MRERPIIFSGEMVKAILEGRKTQTRRIVKDIHPSFEGAILTSGFSDGCVAQFVRKMPSGKVQDVERKSPYGQPGDQLWVREAWASKCGDLDHRECLRYKASYDPCDPVFHWKPSIHMPRSASRITLEITNVRVKRLQDINEDEIEKEGIDPETNDDYAMAEHYQSGGSPIEGGNPHRFAFISLWNKIHGPGAWDKNPWVWVIDFRSLTP